MRPAELVTIPWSAFAVLAAPLLLTAIAVLARNWWDGRPLLGPRQDEP